MIRSKKTEGKLGPQEQGPLRPSPVGDGTFSFTPSPQSGQPDAPLALPEDGSTTLVNDADNVNGGSVVVEGYTYDHSDCGLALA